MNQNFDEHFEGEEVSQMNSLFDTDERSISL